MATYKVPQDVEADDKLLGPFSFRQFIYLIIVAVGIGLGWLFFTILPPLVVIPLPIVVFFGALALPIRKDQPMEVYLAAILAFYLKPRQRMWDPDGVETLVNITAPRSTEPQRTKGVSSSEAEQRLQYLSNLSDTRGWSVRGINEVGGSSMNSDVFNEAQQTQDVLDSDNVIAQNFNQMISANDQRRHQDMLNRFQTAAQTPGQHMDVAPLPPPRPAIPDPYAGVFTQPVATPDPFASVPAPQFNPYPTSMNQTVIQPLSATPTPPPAAPQTPATPAPTPPQTPETTSAPTISPDIMKLASNAREAHRITEKEANLDSEEVVISLR
jgi:hypothetical protein